MVVDGLPNVRTCVTPARDGMVIETQVGRGDRTLTADRESMKDPSDGEN
jgi:hypothetical protein